MPHETVDPIVIGAHIVTALQTIVSRQRDPLEPAVVSVTTFQAGKAHNVISNSAVLTGTVRTFDPKLREEIPQLMERLVRGLTEAFGATYTLNYVQGYRATVNDPVVTEVLRGVVREALGDQALIEAQPTMGGEDFSAYLTKAPGAFILIGVRTKGPASTLLITIPNLPSMSGHSARAFKSWSARPNASLKPDPLSNLW